MIAPVTVMAKRLKKNDAMFFIGAITIIEKILRAGRPFFLRK